MSEAAVALGRPEIPPGHVALPMAQVLRIAGEYEQTSRYDDAEALLRPILDAAPRQPEALHLLGLVAFRKNRLDDSVRLVEQAIAQGTNAPLFFRNICTIYERLGRYDEAIAAGKRAIALDPYDPDAYHNLTVTYYRLLQLEDSMACARRAMELNPSLPAPHFAMAEALLLQGEMEQGWEQYEYRFRIPGAGKLMPPTDRPQWDGKPLGEDTLLLVADQGFGDVIQFARYIPWARERCPKIVLACSAEMQPLMRHIYPWLPLFNRWDLCPGFATFSSLSGLPRLHGTRLHNMPAEVPYITAEAGKSALWKQRLDRTLPQGKRRIGLVWSGRPQPPNRSTTLQALAPITALDGIAIVSLQMGDAQGQIGSYYGRAPLVGLGHEIADFTDTTAIIDNLDLVVTIDTAVGHLAGAMGKPVWIMLPYSPDWRWLLNREDTPWYPTARLFRQPEPRRWEPVIARIAGELRAWISGNPV